MAAKKTYYWRGPGELLGCQPGEEIPVSKMDKTQLAKMKADGRIQETAFAIADDTGVVAELKANVKTLSEKIVELNKVPGGDGYVCEDCKEKDLRIVELDSEVKRLTGELDEATKPAGDKK